MINYVNTGSSANSGNGDSLRTAFTKINNNFFEISQELAFSTSTQNAIVETVTGGSQTGITVTYNTSSGVIDYVVPNNQDMLLETITGGSNIGILVNYNTNTEVIDFIVPTNIATTSTLGEVVVSSGLQVSEEGMLSADVGFILSSISQDLIPASNNQYNLGSLENQWNSLYVSTATIYFGGTPVSIDLTKNTLVVGTDSTTTTSTSLATEAYVQQVVTQELEIDGGDAFTN